MSNKKQTTVEWLIEKLRNRQNAIFNGFPHLSLYEIFKQAKELEMQQIKDARQDGMNAERKGYGLNNEDYYTETYRGNNE